MADTPSHAVIARFNFEDAAGTVLAELKEKQKTQGLGIHNAAVLAMGEDGKLHISETADMRGGKGALVGGTVGGVLGLFGTSILWPLGVGAAIGALAAKLRDSGFPDQELATLGEGLKPGMSLLVIAVDKGAEKPIKETLRRFDADVIFQEVDHQVAQELESTARQ